MVNKNLILSKRSGRTIMKEQIAIIYNNNLKVLGSYDYNDKYDYFERPPLVVLFDHKGYKFFIIAVHVKPTNATNEIKALNEVYKRNKFRLKNGLIIGDLNADCDYVKEPLLTEWEWIIEEPTSTKTECVYDNILIRPGTLIGYSGVNHNITMGDHYPVYIDLKTD